MRLTSCLPAAVLFLIAGQATALTGTELNRFCSEPKGSSGNLSCFAYIRGLIDGLFLADNLAGSGVRYCPPNNGLDVEPALSIVKSSCMTIRTADQNAGSLATPLFMPPSARAQISNNILTGRRMSRAS
jgi:hypothetical protein